MASADNASVDDIYRDYAAEQLALGRAKIQQGALTDALEPLRRASGYPTTAAAAHNAMGVVYAKLGRKDVAERMFRMAMAEAPGEAKFAANLRRLETEGMAVPSAASAPAMTAQAGGTPAAPSQAPIAPPALALAAIKSAIQATGPAPAVTPAVAMVRPAFGSAVQVSQPTGPIQRLSRFEVRVGGAAPAMPLRVRQALAADLRNYPQRIRIQASGPSAPGSAVGPAAYPVRVNF